MNEELKKARENWPDVILVHPDEYERALTFGWDPKHVIRPTIVQLEGRRWKSMIITWAALEVIGGYSAITERIHMDSVSQMSPVTISDIPPARNGGDPNACPHNIVKYDAIHGIHICENCDKLITSTMWNKKNYEFDVRYNIWIHKDEKKLS